MRINFHTPSVGSKSTLLFPDLSDPNVVFLKEVTFKNQDRKGEANHLCIIEKQIKECIKKLKVQEQEEDEKKELQEF